MSVVRVISTGRGTLIFRDVGDLCGMMEQLIIFIQCLPNFQYVFYQHSSPLTIASNNLIHQINPLQQDLHTILVCLLGAVHTGGMFIVSTNKISSSLGEVPTNQLHTVAAPLQSRGDIQPSNCWDIDKGDPGPTWLSPRGISSLRPS